MKPGALSKLQQETLPQAAPAPALSDILGLVAQKGRPLSLTGDQVSL